MAQTNSEASVWVNKNHPSQPRKAPATQVGLLGWLRSNLFSNIGNSFLTVASLLLIYFLVTGLGRWVFIEAFWTPVWVNAKLFSTGTYPVANLFQPAIVLAAISLLFGLSAGQWGSIMRSVAIGLATLLLVLAILPLGMKTQLTLAGSLILLILGYLFTLRINIKDSYLTIAWFLSIPFAMIIFKGGISLGGMDRCFFGSCVTPNFYGGFMLTVLLTVVGITFSFPLGVLLALGRRSNLPVVKWFSIAYIETIRGVPLITLLFMGMIMLPLFLPPSMGNPSSITRVMFAVTMFSAAYLAENVRGGLQSIPKGQWEAADALGLSGYQKLSMIVLPQALRAVIPAIVGLFIGLFKDTSLVALVGLADLLGIARAVISQPDWLKVQGGITREVYVFIGVIYFIFSYGMSWASRQLETQLGVGHR
ncbi:MAG: amino acid ABC transporter permease [Caldilineaceae bacterium]|nr:amino acid ABC transporter permease [Caldilineaceae bacterium]MBP8108963.1 amino acid ABC transporter permease [Caldilineaceae bacterium]MBP8124852.1 amino acid ABC transporter permease [Caldilineaceae bacterium]MBP9074130.1 amino acid ABC transporter permease [Caldilineaceae bacterium]